MKDKTLLLLFFIVFAACVSPAPLEGATRALAGSSLDVKIFRYLNGSLANPVFDAVMPIVTDFRRWRIILIVIWSLLVLFGGPRERWAAFMLIPLVAASDQISSNLIKSLVRRMRPCEILGNVHLWYGPEGWLVTPTEVLGGYKTSFSFPSSHAANITASMLFLGLAFKKWLIPTLAVAILVSFSRIYIGVHWPSDVMAGVIIGALLAWPAYVIFKRILGERIGRIKVKKPGADQDGRAYPHHPESWQQDR